MDDAQKKILKSYYNLKGSFIKNYSIKSELLDSDCLNKITLSINKGLWNFEDPENHIRLGVRFAPIKVEGPSYLIKENNIYFTLFLRDFEENGDTTRTYETFVYNDEFEGMIPCKHNEDILTIDTLYTVVPEFQLFSKSCITNFVPNDYSPGVYKRISKADFLNKNY